VRDWRHPLLRFLFDITEPILAPLRRIIPALESAHAVAHAMTVAAGLGPDQIVLVNLSGRGDKDLDIVRQAAGDR